MNKQKVVILGGYGTYGSLIAKQLSQSKAQIIIAGRNKDRGKAYANAIGAEFVFCDVTDKTSLQTTISETYLVVNAAGPFQAQDYSIPQTCIEQSCHYIDLGDG